VSYKYLLDKKRRMNEKLINPPFEMGVHDLICRTVH